MKGERWQKLVQQPEALQYDKDLPLIKELIETFPYFSAPYTLLARLLHQEKSIYFDKYLKLASIYTGNRETLYRFLHTSEDEEIETQSLPEPTVIPLDNKNLQETLKDKPVKIDLEKQDEAMTRFSEAIIGSTLITMAEAYNPLIHNSEEDILEDKVATKEEEKQLSEMANKIGSQLMATNNLTKEIQKNNYLDEQQKTENFNSTESIENTSKFSKKTEEISEEKINDIGKASKFEDDKSAEKEEIIGKENTEPVENKTTKITEENTIDIGKPSKFEDESKIEKDTISNKETSHINQAEIIEGVNENEIVENKQETVVSADNKRINEETVSTEQKPENQKEKIATDLPEYQFATFDYFAGLAEIEATKTVETNLEKPTKEEFLHKETSTVEKNKIQKEIEGGAHSFSEWLTLFSGKNKKTEKKPEKPENNFENLSTEKEPIETTIKPVENREETKITEEIKEPTSIGRTEKKDFNYLIDNFIKNEPRIKPRHAKIYKAEDMARNSVEDDREIASETLANIYTKQGFYDKAIEIYNRLMLKFPDKSNYFAVKIQEVQKLKA